MLRHPPGPLQLAPAAAEEVQGDVSHAQLNRVNGWLTASTQRERLGLCRSASAAARSPQGASGPGRHVSLEPAVCDPVSGIPAAGTCWRCLTGIESRGMHRQIRQLFARPARGSFWMLGGLYEALLSSDETGEVDSHAADHPCLVGVLPPHAHAALNPCMSLKEHLISTSVGSRFRPGEDQFSRFPRALRKTSSQQARSGSGHPLTGRHRELLR